MKTSIYLSVAIGKRVYPLSPLATLDTEIARCADEAVRNRLLDARTLVYPGGTLHHLLADS